MAGRNGAGKSQLLEAAKNVLGDRGVLIQLHQLCEQTRDALRSRGDVAGLVEDDGEMLVGAEILGHVGRIVGRDYDEIQWFALDLGPTDEDTKAVLSLGNDGDDQGLVPHFRVRFNNVEYWTPDMGLGELSIHILFWVLEQYRHEEGLTLLLDEPDAYLPPIGSARLLARLQGLCRSRAWNLVITTHSEEMIRAALENDGLVVLRRGVDSSIEAARSWEVGGAVADDLLSRPPVDLVLFCEDESAAALCRALLRASAADRGLGISVVWKGGTGDLNRLAKHLPRYQGMLVKFGIVYDGDQRGNEGRGDVSAGWQTVFLPTAQDPDELFKSLASARSRIAERLQVLETVVAGWLDSLGGSDKHDWVNGLCELHGNRMAVLDALGDLWVADHPGETTLFSADIECCRRPADGVLSRG